LSSWIGKDVRSARVRERGGITVQECRNIVSVGRPNVMKLYDFRGLDAGDFTFCNGQTFDGCA
jgi:hypothetical protein